jgi:O-antigen ligase
MDVAGNIRSNGTFAHPNSAAMFFAIAAVASLWCYLLDDRHRYDAILVALFACALVATFSIDGLITLFAMFAGLGAIRSGCLRAKLAPAIIGGVVVAAFFATPLGANRIAGESSTNFSSAERGEANSSLAWRVHKWKSMLPEWEESPLVGQGLGTTTTTDRKVINEFSNALPHNEYVRYLVETGVLGLAILLLATVLLIRRLFRILRTAVPTVSGGAVLALSVVFGCLVNSLADNTLLNSPTCYAAALIVFGTLGSYSAQAARSPT